MRRYDARNEDKSPYEERVVSINRVAKVVKGGRRFSFAALVVVGDGAGRVGVGYGKAKEVPRGDPEGRRGGASRKMFEVPMMGTTIPHEVIGEDGGGRRAAEAGGAGDRRHRRRPRAGAGRVPPGSRTSCRSRWGRRTRSTSCKAAVAGLQALRRPEDIARSRGREVHEVAPKPMLEAMAAAEERTSAARAAALQEQYGVDEPSPGGSR